MSDRSPSAGALRRLRSHPAVAIAGALALVAVLALGIDLVAGPS